MDWIMYLLITVLVVMIILHLIAKLFKPENEIKRTHYKQIPSELIPNNKIISIKNADIEDVKHIIQDFCQLYNIELYKAIPKLNILSDNEFVITFPYDIEFEIFCFFINYLSYPENIKYTPEIKAWTKISEHDNCPIIALSNKEVMLYIPEDDEEYDNVYICSQDNISHKIDFSFDPASSPLDEAKLNYLAADIDLSKSDNSKAQLFDIISKDNI